MPPPSSSEAIADAIAARFGAKLGAKSPMSRGSKMLASKHDLDHAHEPKLTRKLSMRLRKKSVTSIVLAQKIEVLKLLPAFRDHCDAIQIAAAANKCTKRVCRKGERICGIGPDGKFLTFVYSGEAAVMVPLGAAPPASDAAGGGRGEVGAGVSAPSQSAGGGGAAGAARGGDLGATASSQASVDTLGSTAGSVQSVAVLGSTGALDEALALGSLPPAGGGAASSSGPPSPSKAGAGRQQHLAGITQPPLPPTAAPMSHERQMQRNEGSALQLSRQHVSMAGYGYRAPAHSNAERPAGASKPYAFGLVRHITLMRPKPAKPRRGVTGDIIAVSRPGSAGGDGGLEAAPGPAAVAAAAKRAVEAVEAAEEDRDRKHHHQHSGGRQQQQQQQQHPATLSLDDELRAREFALELVALSDTVEVMDISMEDLRAVVRGACQLALAEDASERKRWWAERCAHQLATLQPQGHLGKLPPLLAANQLGLSPALPPVQRSGDTSHTELPPATPKAAITPHWIVAASERKTQKELARRTVAFGSGRGGAMSDPGGKSSSRRRRRPPGAEEHAPYSPIGMQGEYVWPEQRIESSESRVVKALSFYRKDGHQRGQLTQEVAEIHRREAAQRKAWLAANGDVVLENLKATGAEGRAAAEEAAWQHAQQEQQRRLKARLKAELAVAADAEKKRSSTGDARAAQRRTANLQRGRRQRWLQALSHGVWVARLARRWQSALSVRRIRHWFSCLVRHVRDVRKYVHRMVRCRRAKVHLAQLGRTSADKIKVFLDETRALKRSAAGMLRSAHTFLRKVRLLQRAWRLRCVVVPARERALERLVLDCENAFEKRNRGDILAELRREMGARPWVLGMPGGTSLVAQDMAARSVLELWLAPSDGRRGSAAGRRPSIMAQAMAASAARKMSRGVVERRKSRATGKAGSGAEAGAGARSTSQKRSTVAGGEKGLAMSAAIQKMTAVEGGARAPGAAGGGGRGGAPKPKRPLDTMLEKLEDRLVVRTKITLPRRRELCAAEVRRLMGVHCDAVVRYHQGLFPLLLLAVREQNPKFNRQQVRKVAHGLKHGCRVERYLLEHGALQPSDRPKFSLPDRAAVVQLVARGKSMSNRRVSGLTKQAAPRKALRKK